MEKPARAKVQFGICDKCYNNLSEKGELLTETFLDTCVYHIHSKQAIPFSILQDRHPIHIESVLKQLENENYITTHETSQGLFVLPRQSCKHNTLPIYCSNAFLGCSRAVLEQNYND